MGTPQQRQLRSPVDAARRPSSVQRESQLWRVLVRADRDGLRAHRMHAGGSPSTASSAPGNPNGWRPAELRNPPLPRVNTT